MTRAEMLAELRELIDDTTSTHQFWSDTRLLAYLAEGQDKFCEDTGFFRDKSNFTIELETGVSTYDIPDRVIEVIDIFDGNVKLGKILTGTAEVVYPDWSEAVETTGRPRYWRTDNDTGMIELSPTPTADENEELYTLLVWRYSLYDLAGYGATPGVAAEPELRSQLQRACICWAAYKAFSHHDAESQDPVKAKEHLDDYREYVYRGKLAFNRLHNIETRVAPNQIYAT